LATKKKEKIRKKRKHSSRRFRLAVATLTVVSLALFSLATALIYHTLRFTALVDARLQGERLEKPTLVYAREFELRRGQRISRDELLALLNDLAYQETPTLGDEPATFSRIGDEVRIRRRGAFTAAFSVSFTDRWVTSIRELSQNSKLERVVFEPVPAATLFGEDRTKRRWVALEDMPAHLVGAIIATEDKRFFTHTGLDPVGIARALATDLSAGEMRQGASTISQQLVKNYFLTPERTLRRKLLEAYLAIILENRATKEEILELYLNDVYLGQRGSFGINGVGQGAQIFFGKDVKNLGAAEAALIAAVIRSPNSNSPFRFPAAAKSRRAIVLGQMAETGVLTPQAAEHARASALVLAPKTVDRGEAPYFIDVLTRNLIDTYDAQNIQTRDLRVQSTMDRYLQNAAQQAVVEGLEEIRAKLKRPEDGVPQAALVAMSPYTGDVLALVGARSYGTSQFNRAVDAHRQPGSAFKPFVYLAAFEKDSELSPKSSVVDEPTTFRQGNRHWTPQNYSRRFEGRVSYRRALALSLNVATARVGESTGFEEVVSLWELMGMSSRLEPYPSLVLGSFEVTPLELATAFSVLANGGSRVEPRFFTRVEDSEGHVLDERPVSSRRVASPESTYLVTEMLQSVISYGTAKEIRARGFTAQAAGKTGTTNDTRDAWFVGYTPYILAAVWVGFDDNKPLGLSGSQAALPIWTRFMKAAVSGKEKARFAPPPSIVFAEIDPVSGKLATDSCPRRDREVFRRGTEPRGRCTAH
jgi:penicillin-binding protein 1B